jgi:Zn-dependent metalloprotease
VQQTYNGLRISNALGKVLIKGEQILSEKNNFNRNSITIENKSSQSRFSEDIFKQQLKLKEIRVNYLPDIYFEKNGVYVHAKELIVTDKNSSDIWHVVADADSGEILQKINQIHRCDFGHLSSY